MVQSEAARALHAMHEENGSSPPTPATHLQDTPTPPSPTQFTYGGLCICKPWEKGKKKHCACRHDSNDQASIHTSNWGQTELNFGDMPKRRFPKSWRVSEQAWKSALRCSRPLLLRVRSLEPQKRRTTLPLAPTRQSLASGLGWCRVQFGVGCCSGRQYSFRWFPFGSPLG